MDYHQNRRPKAYFKSIIRELKARGVTYFLLKLHWPEFMNFLFLCYLTIIPFSIIAICSFKGFEMVDTISDAIENDLYKFFIFFLES